MRKSRKKKRIIFLRKTTKIHASFTLLLIIFYVAVSLVWNPRFILDDARDKYAHAATIQILARVAGEPGQPIPSGQGQCLRGVPYVSLSWNATSDTDTYDIERDFLALTTGLQTATYQDNAVLKNTTYAYIVTANGPKGSTASDPLSISVPACPVLSSPTCQIETIDTNQISALGQSFRTTDTEPTFSGTTNIPNAKIEITLEGKPTIFATTSANANGYWEWSVPQTLEIGSHIIYATALDPNDSTRAATDHFSFEIYIKNKTNNNSSNNSSGGTTSTNTAVPSTNAANTTSPGQPNFSSAPQNAENPATPDEGQLPSSEKPTQSAPFDLNIQVGNSRNVAYVGKDLEINSVIKNITCFAKNIKIDYDIFDQKNNKVASGSSQLDCGSKNAGNFDLVSPALAQDLEQPIKLTLPKNLAPGQYRIVLKIPQGDKIVAAEASFEVREVPLVTLTSGAEITPTQILRYTSWIIMAFLLVLFLFLILLVFEHRLAQNALIQITENYLARKGFTTKRKEVSR